MAIVSAGIFVAAFVWRYLTFTGFSNDHYAHLALAQQMLLGERPIRDFSDPGWPLTYLISAAGWELAGSSMAVEWFIATLGFALGAAFTVVAAHRLSGSLAVALVIAVFELLILPRTYSYPKMLAYGAAGWALVALAVNPSVRRLVPMAALIAVAFLLRHDHGAYIGVAAAACAAVASRHDWRLAIRRVALLTAATAVFLAPWALYVAFNGGLANYFDRALEYVRIESNATTLKTWPRFSLVPGQPLVGLARPNRPLVQVTWRTDVPEAKRRSLEQRYGLEHVREGDDDAHFYYVTNPSADNIRALADDPAAAGTVGLGRVVRPFWREFLAYLSPLRLAPALHSLQNAQAWLFWLFWTIPVVAVTVAGWRWFQRREWPGELAAIAGLTVLTLLVDSGFLRDPLSARLADAIVPPTLLGAWLIGLAWTRQRYGQPLSIPRRLAALAVLFITFAAVSAVAELPERIEYIGVGDGAQGVRNRVQTVTRLLAGPHRQSLAPPSRISAALMPFFEYVDRCTSPSDQLIVTGEYPDVLVLAGRGFASDGVVFGVWYSSVAHQADTVADMEAKPALFTLLIDEGELYKRYRQVADYIARDYAVIADVPVESTAPVRVLVHRGRSPTGIDGETRWPCFK